MNKTKEYNADEYVYSVRYWDKQKQEHHMLMETWKQVCDFMQKNGIINYTTKMIKMRTET